MRKLGLMTIARNEIIKLSFDASQRLHCDKASYRQFVLHFIRRLLKSDAPRGDVTTAHQSVYNQQVDVSIRAKSPTCIAGLAEVRLFLDSQKIRSVTHFDNGDWIESGEILLHLRGPAAQILLVERTILNILQRLSGIATLTQQYARQAARHGCHVAGTRKTLWGLLDKSAIAWGGGLTHRLGLSDAAMLKDNHLALLQRSGGLSAIREAVVSIVTNNPRLRFIETEVRTVSEFQAVVQLFRAIDLQVQPIIMFDHFQPSIITELTAELRKSDQIPVILTEASGNISLDNLTAYAASGVDVLSVGALTHSAPSADFTLLVE